MNPTEINDKRLAKEFKGISFSGYKKSDSKKELLNSLSNGRIEQACYWAAEFICAGHLLELWDIIIIYMSKYIHLGNPKLPLYLQLRFNNFKDILINGYIGNEIKLRNNKKIRSLFAEIIAILCLSTKKHTLSAIKVDKKEFNMANLTDKLKADSISYANPIYLKDDPKELFIAMNELAYNLSGKQNNNIRACYWIEWIMEFENTCKKDKKDKLKCTPRHFASVDTKLKSDPIWMIWEILLIEAANRSKAVKKLADALLDLFTIKYKAGSKRKRKFILYNTVSLITEVVRFDTPIYTETDKIEVMKQNIDVIYKQIKKNEIRPNTDYLFNNSFTNGERNLENTLKKLDKMNNALFIPRDK